MDGISNVGAASDFREARHETNEERQQFGDVIGGVIRGAQDVVGGAGKAAGDLAHGDVMGSIRDIAGGVVKAVEDAVSGRTKTGLSKEAVDEFRGKPLSKEAIDEFRGTLDWKGAIEEFRHKGIGDLLKNIL